MVPLLVFAIAGGAAGLGYCYYRGVHAKSANSHAKEDVTRWEGEGGNVPSVPTPTPHVRPQSSHPHDSADMHH